MKRPGSESAFLPATQRSRVLVGLLFVVFAATAIWGTPFQYDSGNSGRYLPTVIQAADPALYPDDAAVEAFRHFGSLFYRGLAELVRATGITPAAVEPLMFGLFAASQVLLLLMIWGLARRYSSDLLLFVLLGAWLSFPQSPLLGGSSLTYPSMTHSTVSILLGIGGLYLLLRGQVLAFWLITGLSLFSHALVALHLVLCVAPAWYLLKRRVRGPDLIGAIFFGGCVLAYKVWLAPPPMSADEAQLFLQVKADINHIAPSSQGVVGYAFFFTTILLTGLAHWYTRDRQTREMPFQERLAWASIVIGSIVAFVLGGVAAQKVSVTLAQLQPMRIFLWVTLFLYVLLALATVRALRQRPALGMLLVGVWVMELLAAGWWRLVVMLLAIVGLLMLRWGGIAHQKREDAFLLSGIGIVALGMGVAWLLRDTIGADLFRNPFPFLGMLVVFGGALWIVSTKELSTSVRTATVIGILLFGMVGGVVRWQRYYDEHAYPAWGEAYYKDRVDRAWRDVQGWAATHTAKNDRFLVAGGRGNFRVRARRTGEGEAMSALLWVDPSVGADYATRRARIRNARMDEEWDLDQLTTLARAWDFQYVIVEGAVQQWREPVFQKGSYKVYRVSNQGQAQ